MRLISVGDVSVGPAWRLEPQATDGTRRHAVEQR
jgi:hypothetical protein